MLLRIKYTGYVSDYDRRTRPPSTADFGLVCIPVSMQSYIENVEGDMDAFNTQDEQHVGALSTDEMPAIDRAELIECVWTVVTPDGRILELMGLEVEPV